MKIVVEYCALEIIEEFYQRKQIKETDFYHLN